MIGIIEENEKLAELCKLNGVSQEGFEEYQKIYEVQKLRKESTIPQIESKNHEILGLTDPTTLVIGENKMSRCCQKLHGAGEECMRHSATSENGRLFVVKNDKNQIIAQSWMWRNGNVVCFDSIEANGIESHPESIREDEKEIIRKAYIEAAKEMIEKTEKTVAEFKEDKLRAIKKSEKSEEEKQELIKQLDEMCDTSRIKQVTVGQGNWPISKSIISGLTDGHLDGFAARKVDKSNGRVSPLEHVSYISDSDTQYVLAEIPDEDIKVNIGTEPEIKYRDNRRVVSEKGGKITEKTIVEIKKMEAEAHKNSMQMMQNINNVRDLARSYETNEENLRIIRGEDWYYIYSNEPNHIHVHDMARGDARFENEKTLSQVELSRGFERIIKEAEKENKPITAELREDTSYILMLELMKNGLLEQIGDEEAFEYGDEDNTWKVTTEEQEETLKRRAEIRANVNEANTTMHKITFKPTEKYIEYIKRKEKDI